MKSNNIINIGNIEKNMEETQESKIERMKEQIRSSQSLKEFFMNFNKMLLEDLERMEEKATEDGWNDREYYSENEEEVTEDGWKIINEEDARKYLTEEEDAWKDQDNNIKDFSEYKLKNYSKYRRGFQPRHDC